MWLGLALGQRCSQGSPQGAQDRTWGPHRPGKNCTAILAQILKQAIIKNIFPVGSDVPEDLSLYELWHKAQVTGLNFIWFHPHGERLLGNSMGIQRDWLSLALRCRKVKDDKMPSPFTLGVANMVGIPQTQPVTSGRTTTSWAWSVPGARAMYPCTMRTWNCTSSSAERRENQRMARNSHPGHISTLPPAL